MNKGFTLIELLVVVLIIGILAAIALPQYNKAVEKSRASQAFIMVRAMKDAVDRFQLVNGNVMPTSFDEIDIQVPGSGTCGASGSTNRIDCLENSGWQFEIWKEAVASRRTKANLYIAYHYNGEGFMCASTNDDENAKKICIALGGKFKRSGSGNTYYTLSL